MTDFTGPVVGAIATSIVALVVWTAVVIRIYWCSNKTHTERRFSTTVMPLVGWVATLGTLASAIGFAQSAGVYDFGLDRGTLTFIASMGRGALLMGGIMVLVYYSPKPRKPRGAKQDAPAAPGADPGAPGPSRGTERLPEDAGRRD